MRTLIPLALAVLFLACSDDDSDSEPIPQPQPRTSIADAAFESALVDLGLDDAVDGGVVTASVSFIRELNVDGRGITNLTGIEAFAALENLSVRNNALTTLDVSRNTSLLFVWAENNQLESVTIGPNPDFEKLGLSGNRMTGLDVADYPALQLLTLADNAVTGIDVSTNSLLNTFAIEGNPLSCILVSPQQLASIPPNWSKDAEDTYALDCP